MDSKLFIPGVSKHDLKMIITEFDINGLAELKKIAKSKKVRKLKGLNSKTEMAIIRGIKLIQDKPNFMPIGIAIDYAQTLISMLKAWPEISQVLLVGSLRRGIEEVKEIEILVVADSEFIDKLKLLPLIAGEVIKKDKKIILMSQLDIPIIIHLTKAKRWGTEAFLLTGSLLHINALRKLQKDIPNLVHEEEVYKLVGLPWIPPEIRETGYEVEFAQAGLIPSLIEKEEIKGDLHIHSTWSDGANTIEEIIGKSIKLGYKYLAITDHSQSLKVAGGMSPEELARQVKEINNLQVKYPQIHILKGIEVDILADGSLDFNDDILGKLDLVIASVHNNFDMSEEAMTRRITKALSHPMVKILAHPTGRILGKRSGYKVNIAKVIQCAKEQDKVLEINSSPDRLDLRDKHLQLAKSQGVKIVINTDAHSIERMDDMLFGVQTAKRGWQTKDDIINAWSFAKIFKYLKNK